jgi:two-component system sensor histidine kinase UhpB
MERAPAQAAMHAPIGAPAVTLAGVPAQTGAPPSEPEYLAGPPLFWRLLAANLFVVLGGAVVGTALTRTLVLEGAFTPAVHVLMVLGATGLSAALTAVILRLAFRPLRAVRQAIDQTDAAGRPRPEALLPLERYGDPDILAVAQAVRSLWDRLDQHIRLLNETNAQLETQRQELAQKTVELRHLASLVLAAQEDERRRIARELHDETMQSMAALIIGLDRGLKAMPAEVPHLRGAHQTVTRLRDVATRMLEELRLLALDLRPAVLDDHGLAAAVRWLGENSRQRSGLDVVVEIDGFDDAADVRGDAREGNGPEDDLNRSSADRLPSATETALFRITQEALTNVAKHAQAQHATVRLRRTPESVVVEVEDDGIGLPHVADGPPGHMGLLNMRERASLLGGSCVIRGGRGGRGTLVRAELPLAANDARAA